jgi:hypothetical protein
MGWGVAILLRLVALAAGCFFVGCEAVGTYEFLRSQQLNHEVDYVVLAGTGFAVALGLLPAYASYAFKHRQRGIATACWLAVPLVMSVVYYAAIQRTGGAADQAEVERLRMTRAGTLAARTEKDARASWETMRDAARTECTSGPVNQQRGHKCLEAEGKRDAAWAAVLKARKDLKDAPETKPDSGPRRVVAVLSFLTEEKVRLYQPMLIPIGISILASVFLTMAMLLHTPPMPRPWQRRTPAEARIKPDVIDVKPEAVSAPTRAKPRLVHDRTVAAWVITELTHMLTPSAATDEIEIEDLFNAHAARHRAVTPEQFIDYAYEFCKAAKLRTRKLGDRVFIRGVRLVAQPHVA